MIVYTQYGYASVDIDKYKEELLLNSNSTSPERHKKDEHLQDDHLSINSDSNIHN